jgi:serine/threonine-protein kinase
MSAYSTSLGVRDTDTWPDPIMPPLAEIDRNTFLTYLRQSGLVDSDQIEVLSTRHPELTHGRPLARKLVEEGILTPFQAERLVIGQIKGFVLGPYRILEPVGKGGMGRVYKAQHRTMQRIVAVKVLSNTILKTERAIELFLHEIRAVAILQHPNIVTAFDANEVNGRYFLVLEYVDGPNLDQLVRQQGPLSVGLACDFIRQASCGLHYAQLLGMVHRDIKPANILVQRHGVEGESSPGLIKISDFGLARLAATSSLLAVAQGAPGTILTRQHAMMGTPDYLSPEQSCDIHQTDIRSDLYSLGCTFYFLLTGQAPFAGGKPLDKVIRHATASPFPLSSFRGDVPVRVAAIIEKLMAKDPAHRYQTPGELVEALIPFAVTGPTPWVTPSRASELSVDPEPLAEPSDNDLASFASATDVSTTVTASLSRVRHEQNQRVGLAVIVAILLAAGFLSLIALIGLLASQ